MTPIMDIFSAISGKLNIKIVYYFDTFLIIFFFIFLLLLRIENKQMTNVINQIFRADRQKGGYDLARILPR